MKRISLLLLALLLIPAFALAEVYPIYVSVEGLNACDNGSCTLIESTYYLSIATPVITDIVLTNSDANPNRWEGVLPGGKNRWFCQTSSDCSCVINTGGICGCSGGNGSMHLMLTKQGGNWIFDGGPLEDGFHVLIPGTGEYFSGSIGVASEEKAPGPITNTLGACSVAWATRALANGGTATFSTGVDCSGLTPVSPFPGDNVCMNIDTPAEAPCSPMESGTDEGKCGFVPDGYGGYDGYACDGYSFDASCTPSGGWCGKVGVNNTCGGLPPCQRFEPASDLGCTEAGATTHFTQGGGSYDGTTIKIAGLDSFPDPQVSSACYTVTEFAGNSSECTGATIENNLLAGGVVLGVCDGPAVFQNEQDCCNQCAFVDNCKPKQPAGCNNYNVSKIACGRGVCTIPSARIIPYTPDVTCENPILPVGGANCTLNIGDIDFTVTMPAAAGFNTSCRATATVTVELDGTASKFGSGDIMFVLDRSGSMDEPKLTAAKAALDSVVDFLLNPNNGTFSYGLVSFNHMPNQPVDVPLSTDITGVKNGIAAIDDGTGCTSIGDGWCSAESVLAAHSCVESDNDYIIIASDGMQNVLPWIDDVGPLIAKPPAIPSTTVFAIGVGGERDSWMPVLEEMAKAGSGRGKAYHENDIAGLAAIYDDIVRNEIVPWAPANTLTVTIVPAPNTSLISGKINGNIQGACGKAGLNLICTMPNVALKQNIGISVVFDVDEDGPPPMAEGDTPAVFSSVTANFNSGGACDRVKTEVLTDTVTLPEICFSSSACSIDSINPLDNGSTIVTASYSDFADPAVPTFSSIACGGTASFVPGSLNCTPGLPGAGSCTLTCTPYDVDGPAFIVQNLIMLDGADQISCSGQINGIFAKPNFRIVRFSVDPSNVDPDNLQFNLVEVKVENIGLADDDAIVELSIWNPITNTLVLGPFNSSTEQVNSGGIRIFAFPNVDLSGLSNGPFRLVAEVFRTGEIIPDDSATKQFTVGKVSPVPELSLLFLPLMLAVVLFVVFKQRHNFEKKV